MNQIYEDTVLEGEYAKAAACFNSLENLVFSLACFLSYFSIQIMDILIFTLLRYLLQNDSGDY